VSTEPGQLHENDTSGNSEEQNGTGWPEDLKGHHCPNPDRSTAIKNLKQGLSAQRGILKWYRGTCSRIFSGNYEFNGWHKAGIVGTPSIAHPKPGHNGC
jgi:hypothetical protein